MSADQGTRTEALAPELSAPAGGVHVRGLAPSKEVLANGLTVIAKETRTTPAVTLHAIVRAGTAFDPPSTGGLSHFVSRTIDRGSEAHSADQIAEILDSHGVALSVSVNRHALSLVCTCLIEDFDTILSLLGELVMHPTFPPAEVDRRRSEIVTLIRQDEDSPAAVASEALMAVLYGDAHPYGRRPRGTIDSVETIDGPSLQRFHADHFVPAAVSLAIVGDIAPRRATDAATAVFGNWKAAPARQAMFPAIPAAGERRTRVIPMMSKAQTDIAYGFTTIQRSDPSYYAYWLMNNILGQYSLGGRLGDSIRERQGMAYYVLSSLDANVIPGPLVIRAGVNATNVQRAVASIDAELAKLAAEGPSEREMTESKQYLIGSMPRTLETNIGIANFLQTSEFFGLGLDYDVRVPALLQTVTRDQVHDVARHAVDPSRAAVVVAGPFDGTLQ